MIQRAPGHLVPPGPSSGRRVGSVTTKESTGQSGTPVSSRAPWERVALAVATAGGAGLAPVAPGTAGSLVGIPVFLLLARPGPALLLLSLLALFAAGVWASEVAERVWGRADDGRIVVDEVLGQGIALLPLAWPGLDLGAGARAGVIVTAFVTFRVLDIAKPSFVGRLETRFSGGLGVMLDDVAAGLLSLPVSAAALAVADAAARAGVAG